MTAKQVLKECQIFSALNDSELEKVATLAAEKQYKAGTTLFEEGDSADEFLVIEEGKVALQLIWPSEQGKTGRRTTVDLLSANDMVGWSATVEASAYTFTAVCLQNVKALSIRGSKFRKLLRDDHEMGHAVLIELIRVVASRLDATRRLLISERQPIQGVTQTVG